jgi:chromosome segregation ATPase
MKFYILLLILFPIFNSCEKNFESTGDKINELENELQKTQSELFEKEKKLEEYKEKLSKINKIIDDLNEEVSSLRGHISDFDYHDWEIIIEDIKYRSGNVEDLVEKLKSYDNEDSRYGRRGRLH